MDFYSYFFGMNIIWWIIWIILLFWIFAIPYNIPGQRRQKDNAFDLLQKRYAQGHISEAEYFDKKRIMEIELSK